MFLIKEYNKKNPKNKHIDY